ncbi:MAG: hypothetical protein K6U08_02950 [Firmicutes bacterium]|nr:hypothetical protein [Bacillota bacterium]
MSPRFRVPRLPGVLLGHRRTVAVGLAVVVSVLVLWVGVPSWYVVVEPGPSPDVSTLVVPVELQRGEAGGGGSGVSPVPSPGPEERGGRFLLTTGRAEPAGVPGLWRALASDEVVVLPRTLLIPRGMSEEVYTSWALGLMAESQAQAACEAWWFLGRSTRVVSDGGYVHHTVAGSPAHGKLRPGDILVSWTLGGSSGTFVTGPVFEREVVEAFFRGPGGPGPRTLILTVRREGRPTEVKLELSADDLIRWPFLGLAAAAEAPRTDPPVPVRFPAGDIGGPSGGLMLSLQILDYFTPGDATGGKIIAGTGTVGPGGEVGRVGGVALKLRAAAREGATVFLVSLGDYAEALRAAREAGLDSVRVVAVNSLADAYQALVSLTARNDAGYNGPGLPPPTEGPTAQVNAGR